MRRLRERIQYLKIKKKSYRLLKGFAGILPGKSNNVKLKKEKNRDEKGFKISVNFIKASDNISFISNLKIF
jgi:hypothetical protein